MARAGAKLNRKAVAGFLHNDPGGQAAVLAAAETVANEARSGSSKHSDEVFVDTYHTDRFVAGVRVPAHAQARDGMATRAASSAGLSQGNP